MASRGYEAGNRRVLSLERTAGRASWSSRKLDPRRVWAAPETGKAVIQQRPSALPYILPKSAKMASKPALAFS